MTKRFINIRTFETTYLSQLKRFQKIFEGLKKSEEVAKNYETLSVSDVKENSVSISFCGNEYKITLVPKGIAATYPTGESIEAIGIINVWKKLGIEGNIKWENIYTMRMIKDGILELGMNYEDDQLHKNKFLEHFLKQLIEVEIE